MVNFDINVFNNGAYNNKADEWMLCPYTLVDTSAGWGTGKELSQYNLILTELEAFQLGLEDSTIWEQDDWIEKDRLVQEFGLSTRIEQWVKEVEQAIDMQTAMV